MLISHPLELAGIGSVTVTLLEGHSGRCVGYRLGPPTHRTLVRMQSRCTYGEVFGSIHCDCRDQLTAAWASIRMAGSGLVIYLDQDGRGAGAVAKAQAYRDEAERGVDTFTSYARQGLPGDQRSYAEAVELLQFLGVKTVRLLTNNPLKLEALSVAGLGVEHVPLVVAPRSEQCRRYLQVKREEGHLL